MRILRPHDICPIRKKYPNDLLSLIWMYDPHYIEWIMFRVVEYCIDTNQFMALPFPKSVRDYDLDNAKKVRAEMITQGKAGVHIGRPYHFTNQILLGKDLEGKGIVLPQIEFQFSETALIENLRKMKLLYK